MGISFFCNSTRLLRLFPEGGVPMVIRCLIHQMLETEECMYFYHNFG